MRIVGSFATEPVPIRFELAFQVVDNSWTLFGIRVVPLEPVATAEFAVPGIPLPTPRPDRADSD